MDRRDFLRGALMLLGTTAIPHVNAAPLPRIWLDGINDDTEGLQAALSGLPFQADTELVSSDVKGLVHIRSGHLLTSNSLFVRGMRTLIIGDNDGPRMRWTHTTSDQISEILNVSEFSTVKVQHLTWHTIHALKFSPSIGASVIIP